VISVEVLGEPAPKGSMRAMLVRGRAIMIPGGSRENEKALKAWAKAIRDRVGPALGDPVAPLYSEQPLELGLVFRLVRPKGHWGTGRNSDKLKPAAPLHPSVKPDIDKLARSTLDALTGLLYDDDARIAVLTVVKQWVQTSAQQGVVITCRPLPTSV
jgi:Holliday junction resolvase RusA-like endonuclease